MKHRIYGWIAAAAFCALLSAPAVSTAQTTGSERGDVRAEQHEEPFDGPFSPGTFDLNLHGGFAGITWVWMEPGIEAGLVEIADGVVIGGGAMLNAGVCSTCPLVGLFPGVEYLRAWYVSPKLRASVHLNLVAEAFDMPQLDLYGGVYGGPSFYRVSMRLDPQYVTGEASSNSFGIVAGPFLGMRYLLSEGGGFFVTVEIRALAEFATRISNVEVDTEDDRQIVRDRTVGLRRGARMMDWHLGIGYRF